jgi:hypothetical protein
MTETISITGTKIWKHPVNPGHAKPSSITVLVKANGQTIIQRSITSADNWQWRFTLERYDSAGREIVYTVDELPVPDYVKTIRGYSIVNTHKSLITDGTVPPTDGSTDTPKTGDDNRLALWLLLITVFMLGTEITRLGLHLGVSENVYVPQYAVAKPGARERISSFLNDHLRMGDGESTSDSNRR